MCKNSSVKKKIGEKAYQFLSRNYNDDFLDEHLPNLFGQLADIRYISESDYPKLKTLLNSLAEEEQAPKAVEKTAKELLDEAGFILIDNIENKSDYLKYAKYFASGEKLCKFDSYDATKRYSKLFFILRKNIKNIQRGKNPDRQDEYSTSCMSVGISMDKHTVVQITSRYNHTVNGCDNTYNSNLDNIIEGLTEAFNKDYNLHIKGRVDIEFKDFYHHSGKYFYYYQEINGVKYGNNTIDGVVYDPSRYLVFDYFLLDMKEKTIRTGDQSEDAFCDLVNINLKNGYKIEIKKGEPSEEDVEHKNKIIIYVN